MGFEVWAAMLSAVVAAGGAILSTRAAANTVRLQHDLELARLSRTRQDATEEIMARYREPLVRAAFDLQGRIYNIIDTSMISRHNADDEERRYVRTSTVFVLAEYLGWVEILRRGVQFLDLGDLTRNHELVERLARVSHVLASTAHFPGAGFRVFRTEQRALGELMMEAVPGEPHRFQCIGYARFVERMENEPAFARWFTRLEHDVARMADPPDGFMARLVPLQRELIALVGFLDVGGTRFPAAHRLALPDPDPGPDPGPDSRPGPEH